jgi:hypothetical protein
VRAGGGRTKGIIKFCGQINQQGAVDATSHDKFEEHGELDMADINVDLNPEESFSQVRSGEESQEDSDNCVRYLSVPGREELTRETKIATPTFPDRERAYGRNGSMGQVRALRITWHSPE